MSHYIPAISFVIQNYFTYLYDELKEVLKVMKSKNEAK